MDIQTIRNALNLQPLPVEGGYYAVTYRSDELAPVSALDERRSIPRSFAGAIYFLATRDQFSAIHCLPSDEIFYYHFGDPLELLMLDPEGGGKLRVLGVDLPAGQRPQLTVPHGYWQGSRPMPSGDHGFTLISASTAPAYMDTDPVFATRLELSNAYPEFREMIAALTPAD